MLTNQRIEEIIAGIDQYLRKLDSFSTELLEIKATLNELRHSQEKSYMWELQRLRSEMGTLKSELQKRGLPEITEYESCYREIKSMVQSDVWPKAVEPKSICTNEDMAFQRAQAILDLVIGESLSNKSFLDFGCGEGHVVMRALEQKTKKSIGYDINASKFKFNNEFFTSEFDTVTNAGPFDIILLQDVLDHTEIETPASILDKARSVLSKNGKIFVRNHPWCSRHGSHLYIQLNKAFAHLALDESELSRLGGYTNDFTIKLYDPIPIYRKWFSEAGFKVCSEIVITKPVESYFETNNLLREKLLRHWGGDEVLMKNSLQIEFAEYILEPMLDEIII